MITYQNISTRHSYCKRFCSNPTDRSKVTNDRVLLWQGSNKGEVEAILKAQEAIDMAKEVPGGTKAQVQGLTHHN